MADLIVKISKWNKNGKDKIIVEYDDGNKVFFDAYRIGEIENQIGSKIKVGNNIPYKILDETEKFLRKQKYSGSWGKEKERIEKVEKTLSNYFKDIKFNGVGFGVDSTDIIYEHPKESGAPDLDVNIEGYEFPLEVTGKQGCGKTLRVRPDKIEYCKNHDIENYRIAHICDREDKIYFIHINLLKEYKSSILEIRGSNEEMVIFKPEDVEVFSTEEFIKEIKGYLLKYR